MVTLWCILDALLTHTKMPWSAAIGKLITSLTNLTWVVVPYPPSEFNTWFGIIFLIFTWSVTWPNIAHPTGTDHCNGWNHHHLKAVKLSRHCWRQLVGWHFILATGAWRNKFFTRKRKVKHFFWTNGNNYTNLKPILSNKSVISEISGFANSQTWDSSVDKILPGEGLGAWALSSR